MRTVNASAEISAPPSDVFAFLANLENLPAWQSGIVSAELKTPGPVGLGSRAHVVRSLMGQRIAVDVVVVGFEPGRSVELESAASGIGIRAVLDLQPGGSGTALSFTMEIRAQNIFMAPAEGLVAGAAEQDLADSLERVRAHFAPPDG